MEPVLIALLILISLSNCTPSIKTKETNLTVSEDGLNRSDHVITRQSLLNSKGLVTEAKEFQIIGFTYLFGSCELAERFVFGSEFSETDKRYISRARANVIRFYNIKAKYKNGKVYILQPLTVQL